MCPANLYMLVPIISLLSSGIAACSDNTDEPLLIEKPEHGFVTRLESRTWEESLVSGNGTLGALVPGDPMKERIILSHERLFMPEYPPTEAPDLGSHMDKIREWVLEGQGEKAAEFAVELGKEVGIEGFIWTNPLIPACQLEIETLTPEKVSNYSRAVDFESGETITAWETESGVFKRRLFASRPDQLIVLSISGPVSKLNLRMRLATLPQTDDEMDHEAEAFTEDKLIKDVRTKVDERGWLSYTTEFKKKWDGSLKGYLVESRVIPKGGTMKTSDGWLLIRDADDLVVLSRIVLSYEMPLPANTHMQEYENPDYEKLLADHRVVHGEMFDRFNLEIGGGESFQLAEELQASSSFGNLNPSYLNQLCEAARYLLISSTGEIPPTLQGIWGGTWRPAWSSDFTLNGNVPSAIASGLNTNFREVTEAYMNYMFSMHDDFRDNARDLYGAPGIFVPSRTSSDGKTYHYAKPYPHLFWYAGGAWTSQFLFDYWQYTGDDTFLKEKAIPFMLDAASFYKHILVESEAGGYNFIPSYSPEIGPMGHHPVVINATMDVAALKQLIRNLLYLNYRGYLKDFDEQEWASVLKGLPEYSIDEAGDLNEWIWPGLKNDNSHRHASHLYPLLYEVDPEFLNNPELIEAAKTAIEKRLEYRRGKQGGEMAFGLVQIGLAAAHIGDTEHAFECVDWLCNSYWSPAQTAYHNPGEIFNVDIAGGLPAVVTEMILQSSMDELILLPALPYQWSKGSIKGVGTRCGVTADLEWEKGVPVRLHFTAHRTGILSVVFKDQTWKIETTAGQEIDWEPDGQK
jgi:alpha-L-fucosidase 2